MTRSLTIIAILFFSLPVFAQSLTGYYTGEMRLTGRNVRMQVQLDLIEDSGNFKGVIRSRYVENLKVTGCENWVEGSLVRETLTLMDQATLRETEVPVGTCHNMMGQVRMNVKQEIGKEPEMTGTWFDRYGEALGRFTIVRIDTAISYTVADDEKEATRLKNERQIALAASDSIRLAMMKMARGVQWLDTLTVPATEATLIIRAPDADLYHKLSVTMNDGIVLLNNSPRRQGAKITLKEMDLEPVELVFYSYHTMVEVMYDIEVTLQWGEEQEKKWTIPVSTFQNRGIVLHFKPRD